MIDHICRDMYATYTGTGRHRCTCRRALHLLDLENLLGDRTRRSEAHVGDIWARYVQNVPVRRDDHIVVATGPSLAPAAWFSLPHSVRRLVGHGVDGADLALLEALEDMGSVAGRYGRVVLGSGDHIFGPALQRLWGLGVDRWHVAGHGASSRVIIRRTTRQIDLLAPVTPLPSAAGARAEPVRTRFA